VSRARDAPRARDPGARGKPACRADPRDRRRARDRGDVLHLVRPGRPRRRAPRLRVQLARLEDGPPARAARLHRDGRRRDGQPSGRGHRRVHPRARRGREPRVPPGRAARRIRVRPPLPRAHRAAAGAPRATAGGPDLVDAIADFLATYSTTLAIVGLNALLALSLWLTLYAAHPPL